MINSQEVRAKIIKNRKTLNSRSDINIGSICFKVIEDNALNGDRFSFRNLLKIFFYAFFVPQYSSLENGIAKTSGSILKTCVNTREQHKNLYFGFLTKLDQKIEGVIFFNPAQYKYKVWLPNLEVLKMAYRNIDYVEGGFWKRIFCYLETVYCLKNYLYYKKILKDKNFKKYYTLGDSYFPESLLALNLKESGGEVSSFQAASFSESVEFKPATENMWLNLNSHIIYCWGQWYKRFLDNKVDAKVIVLGHPSYTNFKNPFLVKDTIVIGFNPPEKKEFNYLMLDLVSKYCQKEKIDFRVRLHPVDSMDNYADKISSNFYKGSSPTEQYKALYLVNETTLYFDLIQEGKSVFRYRNEKSYQKVLEKINDYFSTEDELRKLIKNTSKKDLVLKQQIVMSEIFNLKA